MQLRIYRRPARSRAIGICAGSDPPQELDHQRGTALGPLSALAEPSGGRSALFDFALFSVGGLLLHFSYDRIFQTPSLENVLLSSSTAVESIDPANFLRLPVEPSEGNYYEAGLTKVFAKKLKLDANYFRRLVNNYADDDQIENTAISFPIAFRKSIIYGAEAKLGLEIGAVSRDS